MNDERGEMTPQGMDELASAYLDGDATPQEAALVESDPRLQAVVEELRAVRELVAAPVEPPSDDMADQMIAQALDHRAPVVSLEKARRRLRAVPPQARVILAAAAVVAAIAVVGVTQFDRASRDGDDDMLASDSASAPAMADEAPMDSAESAMAPEASADLDAPAVDMEEAPEPQPADVMADAPAEEAMAADEPAAMAMPESVEAGPAEDDMDSDDSGEPEIAMADEALEPQPTSGDTTLVFETAADLATYARQIAEEQIDLRGAEPTEETAAINLMGCPLFPEEDLELLARFDAVVDEVEAQVSVYVAGSDVHLTETTPPPECQLLNSHTFSDWFE